MMHAVDMARTHEILARYRPIAPRPPLLESAQTPGRKPTAAVLPAACLPTKSPRSRKRGRGSFTFVSQKRAKTYVPVLPSPSSDAQLGLAIRRLAHGFPVFPLPGPGIPNSKINGTREGPEGGSDLLTLSLLPYSSSSSARSDKGGTNAKENTLDLNTEPERALLERDLLGSLQKSSTVIVPQPVRPVGSSISVACINEAADTHAATAAPLTVKRPEEVEEEVESEVLPAIVSDSNHRVRLANSAYKEMVGQPECPWLDSMVPNSHAGPMKVPKRISGEVMLDLSESRVPVPRNGFSCTAKIEWGCNGRKTLISAPCDVVRLSCSSKDYLYTWRFHTTDASVTSSETS